METFTPQKKKPVKNIIIEEIIEERIIENRIPSGVKNITVHEGFCIPAVPDEYDGIPRAEIMIPVRRPFRFSS